MLVHKGYEHLDLIKPVVTIGVFDGVHEGHRTLLDQVINRAKESGGESVVLTFDPNPRLVLSDNHSDAAFLTTSEEKIKLLEDTGIDHLVLIRFDNAISNLSAVDFISEILVRKIRVSYLIVGYDHHFGKDRGGDFNTVRDCGLRYGFRVEKMNEISTAEGVISSTGIREALLKGNLQDANRWLGYDYSLTGRVVAGNKIGRILGFPTANIQPSDEYKLIPANGVYAVNVVLKGDLYNGMLNIGYNPTVSKDLDRRSIEVNIFDLNDDLYGQVITVIFRFRLREEIKFESAEELTARIILDKQQALSLLT